MVTGRKKNEVADDQRCGGADRFADSGSPWKIKKYFAGRRIQSDQPTSREKKGVTSAVERGGDRRRVAGFVFRGFPQQFAAGLVQGNDARAVRSANVQQHGVAFDQRRAGHAEEAFGRLEPALRVHVPNFFAAVEIQTAQGALCAEGEDLPAGDRRRGARAFVETEVIAITGGIIQSPKRFAVLRIEAFNKLFIIQPME